MTGDGLRFDESTISDQKRLVRGEHWLMARTRLRKRDEAHHKSWRILIMAGGSPRGEIEAIRELMPKAHIVAADINEECLSAAMQFGANETVCGDVLEMVKVGKTSSAPRVTPNRDKFDVINLDLCGPVNRRLSDAIKKYLGSPLTTRGILMVTFSYGRDVSEMFLGRRLKEMPEAMSDNLAGRVAYLGECHCLRSVLSYKGNEMPMCSLLYEKGYCWNQPIRYLKIDPDDFGLAVCYPDVARLYDCPAERIQSFRNHFAAVKAVATRKAKTLFAEASE